MRKITKIFVAIALSIGLFLGTEQEEARATGWPTIDISNLLQNILDYIQSGQVAGLFDEISDMEIKLAEWKEKGEQFKRVIEITKIVREGIRFGWQINQSAMRFADTRLRLERYIKWLNDNGATAEGIAAAISCRTEYLRFYESIVEESKEKNKFLESMKSGNALEILQSAEDLLAKFEQDFYACEYYIEQQIRGVYQRERYRSMAMQNGVFFRNRAYY